MKSPHKLLITLLCIMALPVNADSGADTGCFPHVRQIAGKLAQQPYQQTPMLQVDTGRITYDHYQRIRFRPEKTFWRQENLPFQLEFMHPGMHFIRPVELFSWENGKAIPIRFDADYFDYSDVAHLQLERDEPRMGFTGFRILSKLGDPDAAHSETLVFQGASYFRALGRGQRYGLSARGLAINTALAGQEEFPDYTRFWLEKPTPDASQLKLCALLDSPSLTAATRFVLEPGKTTVMEVETQLYPRQPLTETGIAPLTSMFFHGENSPHQHGDYRPEVHDSDGLLIRRDQEWLWQPLAEAEHFNLQSLPADHIGGFGLMQRDRDFDHYQDLEALYHLRPGVWVEPLNAWGAGEVRLLRLPTQSDIHDNVVAWWQSKADKPPEHLHYRLSWRMDDPAEHQLGKVAATRATNRAVDGMPEREGRIRFIVDFNGLPPTKGAPQAEVQLAAGKGRLEPVVVQPNPYIKGWRTILRFYPESCDTLPRLSLHLTDGSNPLTETWSYPVPATLCH